jgi:hypothetical protein
MRPIERGNVSRPIAHEGTDMSRQNWPKICCRLPARCAIAVHLDSSQPSSIVLSIQKAMQWAREESESREKGSKRKICGAYDKAFGSADIGERPHTQHEDSCP